MNDLRVCSTLVCAPLCTLLVPSDSVTPFAASTAILVDDIKTCKRVAQGGLLCAASADGHV